jgi:hypothetical protein
MEEVDDTRLKAEIDEIMSRVDSIMNNIEALDIIQSDTAHQENN